MNIKSQSGPGQPASGKAIEQAVESASRQITAPFRLKKILVPTDFSECSMKALQYAVPFAKQFNAHVTLLHVMDLGYIGTEFGGVDLAALEQEMRDESEKRISELITEEARASVSADGLVRLGRPGPVIADVAKEIEADLIIVATHGRTGLKHIFLGSTAENVVRHAPCPVLTVREVERDFVAT